MYLFVRIFFLIFAVDSCGISRASRHVMHRSSVVSPYWIWTWFHFSSPQNMEVSFLKPAWLAWKMGERREI